MSSYGETRQTEILPTDPFTKAFAEIDTDGDGVITKQDLEAYARSNELGDDSLIEV